MSHWVITVPAAVVGLAVGIYQYIITYKNLSRGYSIEHNNHSEHPVHESIEEHTGCLPYSNNSIVPAKAVCSCGGNGARTYNNNNNKATKKSLASIRVKQVKTSTELSIHYK